MDIENFLDKINTHTKAIYENEINQVSENSSITNWLLGLAGGALLFSFNKYDAIGKDNISIIVFQSVIFIATIVVGFLHRLRTNIYRNQTISIIRMFDFLKIEFDLIPDEIEDDLESEGLITVFDNYLNGEYFDDEDKETFEILSNDQIKSYKKLKLLTGLAVLLMILQFGCFFIIIS